MSKHPRKKSNRSASKNSAAPQGSRHSPEWLVLILALLGMLLTAYLSYSAFSQSVPAFCAADSGCELIQQSRWSRVFGVPLALWGFALYGLLAAMAWRLPAKALRWQRLALVAVLGLGISLYLTLLGWWQLKAFCLWCLLSLTLLAGICVRLGLSRPQSLERAQWQRWSGSCALALLLSIGGLQLAYSDLLEPREDPQLQALAEHLQRIDARFYGAFWCPACQEQKRLFGSSAKRLPYVECAPNGSKGLVVRACLDANVSGYPTWVIRGRRYQQVLSVEELTRYSRFKAEQ
ncbi:vitamin K epoxide reductase family protein [Pseudomonas xionganensis]|uniref:vitamin K epoxide reductase family protein n=1 Tax=Pseudomonas xionganensis TaxID=2654845 RepID=UPI001C49A2C1|nr:vitamin K epoxide reductase family protein [Pseudomonas xionganensis]